MVSLLRSVGVIYEHTGRSVLEPDARPGCAPAGEQAPAFLVAQGLQVDPGCLGDLAAAQPTAHADPARWVAVAARAAMPSSTLVRLWGT